jgi:ubiquinone/menaquinone biosynthesis C-methylase UbiE
MISDPFAELAASYEDWFDTPLGSFVDDKETQALVRALPGRAINAVVDVGAGTGHFSRLLARLGYDVIAVEPSRAMRETGHALSAGWTVKYVDGRAEELQYPEASFEGALFFTSLEFTENPAQALKEAMRVVRPGGWVIAAVINRRSAWGRLYRELGERGAAPWAAANLLCAEDVELLMRRASDQREQALYLPPEAAEPFDEADEQARQAGGEPAIQVLRWTRPSGK